MAKLPVLSVIMPAYNEQDNIEETVLTFHFALEREKIPHEILVINDNSKDNTEKILKKLQKKYSQIRFLTKKYPNGYGFAVIHGIENYKGDCVAIVVADMSDSPKDLIKYYRKLNEGPYDCVFGSRFIKGGSVKNYPFAKLIANRVVNNLVRLLFFIRYNDATNSFKLYRRETMDGIKPFISKHFSLELELSLKSIIRGYRYVVVPNTWQDRKKGVAKLKLWEAGSRFIFVILYCLIEKYFCKWRFKKKSKSHH